MLCKTLITLRVLLYLSCFHTVEGAAPSFSSTTPPVSVDENSSKGVSILTVEGEDTDGEELKFSIVSQTPTSPSFLLDATKGLLTTPMGLDAEVGLTYSFIFGVTDGETTVKSVPFIVNINDIDEFPLLFQGTTNNVSLLNYVSNGYQVFDANATDEDATATATVTYSLTSGNSPVTFSLDSSNGKITVNDSTQLASTSSYSLSIQASDGTNDPVTLTVSINVVDLCNNNTPCNNGGTCVTSGTSYTCTCASGYTGKNCLSTSTAATGRNGGVVFLLILIFVAVK